MPKCVKCEDAISFANELATELTGKDREDFDFYSMLGDVSIALVNYRADQNLTQGQLAKILGVSQAMISKYEGGDYNFSLQTLNHICHVLDLKMNLMVKKKEWQVLPRADEEGESSSMIDSDSSIV